MPKLKDKIAELKAKLQDEELVSMVLAGVIGREKEALAAGVTFKGKKLDGEAEISEDAATFINQVASEVILESEKADDKEDEDEEEIEDDEADEEMEDEGTGGKKPKAKPEDKEEDDEEDEEDEESKELAGLKSIKDATPAQYLSLVSQALSDSLSPYLSEVKQLSERVDKLQEVLETKEKSEDTTSLKELLTTTNESLKKLNRRVRELEGDTPKAAKGYLASEDDDTELSVEEKEKLKEKNLLPTEKTGFDEFASFIIN